MPFSPPRRSYYDYYDYYGNRVEPGYLTLLKKQAGPGCLAPAKNQKKNSKKTCTHQRVCYFNFMDTFIIDQHPEELPEYDQFLDQVNAQIPDPQPEDLLPNDEA